MKTELASSVNLSIFDKYKINALLILFAILDRYCDCGNIIAAAGDPVLLPCSSELPDYVRWIQCPVDNNDCFDVNIRECVTDNYYPRFGFNNTCTVGKCDLIISNATGSDAGEYCCIEEDGKGSRKCMELIVIEPLKCENNATEHGVVGHNDCGIPPRSLQHRCRVKYWGNKPPILIWKGIQGKPIKHGEVSHNKSTTVSTLLTTADEHSVASYNGFLCTTETGKHSCQSAFDVQYAFHATTTESRTDGIVFCTVNASVPCKYLWKRSGEDDVIHTQPHLILNNSNSSRVNYDCFARCVIGNKLCTLKSTTVSYVSAERGPTTIAYTNRTVDEHDQAGSSASNPSLKGISILVSLILGVAVGLLGAALIAWKFGSDIRSFLRPFWFLMSLKNELARETKAETTSLNRRYHQSSNYLECISMKIAILECKAESILDVAGFDDLILSVSGRGTYIDTSLCPKIVTSHPRFFHALSSCFCRRPNTVSDHAANIPEVMTFPWSMAVDVSKRCAFVSSYQNNVICCIPLQGGEPALRKSWKIFDGQKPAAVQVSLSMENNGNIIAVSLESNWIEEYHSDGGLVRKIELQNSDNYAHIQHAVKRTDGQYVLVHGWKEDKYHRVCLVDGNGGLKASYGHSKGDAVGDEGQLNTPTHLALDKNKFVLVTDYNNHRIIMLDPDLKFVKVLITTEACLYRPCRLVLDEREESQLRLYVGEDRKEPKARVIVFFLKRREAFL